MKPSAVFTIAFLSLISVANADFDKILIQNFSGNYNSPNGSGSAAKFIFPEFRDSGSAFNFKFTKRDGGINVKWDDQEQFIPEASESFLTTDRMSWNGLYIKTSGNKINLSFAKYDISSPQSNSNMSSLAAECQDAGGNIDSLYETLIHSCFKNSSMSMQKAYFKGESSKSRFDTLSIPEVLYTAVSAASLKSEVLSSRESQEMKIEKLSLNVNNNKFSFKMKASVGVSATLKGNGQSSYNPNTKTLTLRLDKVKASFLTVTNKVFDALEGLDNDKIRVEKPYIYFNMESIN